MRLRRYGQGMATNSDPMPPGNHTPDEWVQRLGITDRESACTVAIDATMQIRGAGKQALFGDAKAEEEHLITTAHLVLMGLVARAQGFAEAAATAIAANNPYAAFSLLRSYFENAAAIGYVTDKPQELTRLWNSGPNDHGIKVGTITNHARKRFPESKKLYSSLSQYAHPHSVSLTASMRVEDSGEFRWHSAPAFKSEDELRLAAAWLSELTSATCDLLREFEEQHLRPGASAPKPVVAEDPTPHHP